jgi:hypothetical protein
MSRRISLSNPVRRMQVLGELLRAEGRNVHLQRAHTYVETNTGQECSFWDLVLMARRREHHTADGPPVVETVIGWKAHDRSWHDSCDTILNPPGKNRKRRWHANDVLIVIY